MSGYNAGRKAVIVTKPDGTEVEFASGSAAAREFNFTSMMVSQLANGKKDEYMGYKIRFKRSPESVAIRENSQAQTPSPSHDPIPSDTAP